jgi:hypothetical protein
MEICGAFCYEVVVLVVAQQEGDTGAFLGVNLGDCCHGFSRRAPELWRMLTPSFD